MYGLLPEFWSSLSEGMVIIEHQEKRTQTHSTNQRLRLLVKHLGYIVPHYLSHAQAPTIAHFPHKSGDAKI